MTDQSIINELTNKFNNYFEPYGFELKPFNVGWYNELVEKEFKLSYPQDSVAFSIISNPVMFENTFLKYITECSSSDLEDKSDILDAAVDELVTKFIRDNDCVKMILIRDYEMSSVTRRPKVVVRTAGHVAGQVRYYQKCDVPAAVYQWSEGEKIYGCSMHHEYGGWFAFRGVLVLPQLTFSLPRTEPPDPLKDQPLKIVEVLREMSLNWQTWRYRDLLPKGVRARYSGACKLYFSLSPGEGIRRRLVKLWRDHLREHQHQLANGDRDAVLVALGGSLVGEKAPGLDWGMRV